MTQEHRVTQVRMRHAEPTSMLSCTCSAILEATPDDTFNDRNAPLLAAWLRHRADAGVSERSHTIGTGPRPFQISRTAPAIPASDIPVSVESKPGAVRGI